jgi:hypothetical protein
MELIAGKTVQLKVKNILFPYKDRYSQNVYIPEYNDYEGKVVYEKWYKKSQVGLTTGQAWFPVRCIEKHRIVEVNGVEIEPVEEITRPTARVLTVLGSKGEEYEVTFDGPDSKCTCKGFSFRGACKHIADEFGFVPNGTKPNTASRDVESEQAVPVVKNKEDNMTEKLFTVTGFSTKDGKIKARFATDMTRIKTLIKTGHTDIQLYDLPKPANKLESLKYLHEKNIPGDAGVSIAKEYAKRSKRAVADLVKDGPVSVVAEEAVA